MNEAIENLRTQMYAEKHKAYDDGFKCALEWVQNPKLTLSFKQKEVSPEVWKLIKAMKKLTNQ